MRKRLATMNESDAFGFRARGLRGGDVRIGIGLNLGDGCVGNMGSDRHFDYSVIGDAVNIAAWIESSCKDVGYDIVVSQSVVNAVPGFAFLAAGSVPLKGKTEPLGLFAMLGDETYAATPEFLGLAERHAALLKAADETDDRLLESTLAACRAAAPEHLSSFYDRFVDRLTTKS